MTCTRANVGKVVLYQSKAYNLGMRARKPDLALCRFDPLAQFAVRVLRQRISRVVAA
jgi:hypothetical protein